MPHLTVTPEQLQSTASQLNAGAANIAVATTVRTEAKDVLMHPFSMVSAVLPAPIVRTALRAGQSVNQAFHPGGILGAEHLARLGRLHQRHRKTAYCGRFASAKVRPAANRVQPLPKRGARVRCRPEHEVVVAATNMTQ